MTPEQLAERVADYMATRITPWPDEAAMREAVRDTVRLLFTEARTHMLEALGVGALRSEMEDARQRQEQMAGQSWPGMAVQRAAADAYRDALAILEAKDSL
jgi:hypothetical protein